MGILNTQGQGRTGLLFAGCLALFFAERMFTASPGVRMGLDAVGALLLLASLGLRLKDVLGVIENATAKLAKIQQIYFRFLADETRKRRVGLIAQECQVDFPEIVDVRPPPSGQLGMAYGDMVPVLLQAINELSARVEALEQKQPTRRR